MKEERRRWPRVPVYMKVINETDEKDFGFSYAKDISSGGISLETKVFLDKQTDLKLGDLLKVKFKIPGGKLYITAFGEVVRINEGIIGLKFSKLEDDFKKEIEFFVQQTKRGNISFS